MQHACALVPAFDAEDSVGAVIAGLRATLGVPVVVVDDGSHDATGAVAAASGAEVLRHPHNLGKGAALRTGLLHAARQGYRMMVSVDADGQHPVDAARAVLDASDDPRALVLGVRDLLRDGAPRKNRIGNGVSNFFVSLLSGRRLHDTQCGLRRYPVREALALASQAHGYAFEAEVVLRAVAAGLPVLEVPIHVLYPPPGDLRTHFRPFRDPVRIVGTVVRTVLDLRLRGTLGAR